MSYSVAFHSAFILKSYTVYQQIQCFRETPNFLYYTRAMTSFVHREVTAVIKRSVHRFIKLHTVMHVH